MKPAASIALILGALVLIGAGFYYWYEHKGVTPARTNDTLSDEEIANIGTFEECGVHFPIMESYPARCATPDGRTFAQNIGNELSKMDLIRIDAPRPTATVTSPLSISGEARGTWYFEASFPVELQDSKGNIIAQAPAQAQSEWMTENFVPYKVTLTFPKQPEGSRGMLILRKDNPSGEAERDDSLNVPVVF